MILKCLVVDDEPLACKYLEDFIGKVEILELVKSCTSAVEAAGILRQRRIDLLFLDIQMPDMSGIELLQSVNKAPPVIMTTAYDDFAAQSYEYNVVDYLLKPFSFSRFLKAVDKVSSGMQEPFSGDPDRSVPAKLDYIFVNNNGAIERIDLQDIYYIKGFGDYVAIRTGDRNLVIRDNLKRIEKLLAGNDFIRVHKSYIVARQRIESIKGSVISILDEKINIGPLYRQQFQESVNRLKIG